MSTTTSVIAANLDPFAHASSYLIERGTRIYWACTWFHSETPNGRYELERYDARNWGVSHHQVIGGGEHKVYRSLGLHKTKKEAIAAAEADAKHLGDRVGKAILRGDWI